MGNVILSHVLSSKLTVIKLILEMDMGIIFIPFIFGCAGSFSLCVAEAVTS